jgi:pimeloyl-ACP methyl ester carboxylesterase
VFAELAYHLHLAGYNVFLMPKHGGRTIEQLLARHRAALEHISTQMDGPISVYGEGLGGYVVFYLALAHTPQVSSVACQNSPAILTEPAYHQALLTDGGPWRKAARRRRLLLPILTRLPKIAARVPVPVSTYLPWKDLIDTREDTRDVERRLVLYGYLTDPDFDRWYPLSAVMSLLTTPPPAPLDALTTPTMFLVASEGPTPTYIGDLYARLPLTLSQKRLHTVGRAASTGCCPTLPGRHADRRLVRRLAPTRVTGHKQSDRGGSDL